MPINLKDLRARLTIGTLPRKDQEAMLQALEALDRAAQPVTFGLKWGAWLAGMDPATAREIIKLRAALQEALALIT